MPLLRLLPTLTTFLLALPIFTTQAQTFEVIYSDNSGQAPYAGLVQGNDGIFYGTTRNGGTSGNGTIFKITFDGDHSVMLSFNGTNGRWPEGGLVQGGDGDFYGTTSKGGAGNHGTVFKITANGAHTLLHSFNGANGSYPIDSLAHGTDGDFYGTTAWGGANDHGTVFKITAGGAHTLLHSFDGANGSRPRAGLVQGGDGDFYGTTSEGGAGNYGTVFKITASGAHTLLHSFGGTDGSRPEGGLVQGADGYFYGTTAEGGTVSYGTVFKITSSGTHTLLHSFNNSNGNSPKAGLVQGSDGSFYGTTHRGYGTVFKITASGVLTRLHSFNSTASNSPRAPLIQGSDGDFYGTTSNGGPNGWGAVFKITASGGQAELHNFNDARGRNPWGGLVQGNDGAFYGTTSEGGGSGYGSGHGTFFKITANGTHTLLHSFNGTKGSRPWASLVLGRNGAFYGTTWEGGSRDLGTVFRITHTGKHTLLHSFNGTYGSSPMSLLVQGRDGDFYGTTAYGGTGDHGTVFKITAGGTHTVLRGFNGANGSDPSGGLVQGSDGTFYGTTTDGGVNFNGTVFKITARGAHTVLHSFDFHDGSHPTAALVQGSDGSFYGTTSSGGARGYGTVFKITASGTHTMLYSFNETNGGYPSGLVQGSDGAFYGTTYRGGASNRGTVFKITSNGTHSILHSFDGSQASYQAAYPRGTPILGSDGHLYGTADPMVVWRLKLPPAPEIAVRGNGRDIADGDAKPQAVDHTHFGSALASGGAVARTFTIANIGTGAMALTGTPPVVLSGSAAFSVSAQPADAVVDAEGGEQTFTLTFAPATLGPHTAMVSIASDDEDENPFTFTVAGVGGESETEKPSLKLTSPAGRAVSASLPLVVAGVAGDGFAVDRVELVLNGGEVVLADLNHGGKPSAVPFTAQITPVIGENTLTVTAFDPSGNNTSITHVFTFERRYLLTLAREVPAALETMPDKAGTVVLKAAIAKNVTALTKGSPQTSQVLPDTMLTLTAAAKTGHLFSHWTGLPGGAQVRGNVAALVMPMEDTGVTAVFVANPLTQGAMAGLGSKPVFQGLLRPDETTPPGNDTAGFLSAALTPAKGGLSGKLWMDGLVVPFTGALHGDGSVWFKAGKVMSSTLPFAGRELAMTWDESGLTMTVIRTVNEVTHVSTGHAKPPLHSKTTPVRGALLDAKGRQGYFTLALPTVTQDPVKPSAEYPQGSGHAGLTLLANGTLKLAGTLAEGTKVTAASFLVEGDAAEVFVVLPTPGGKTKAGSLLGTLVFDEAQADVTSDDMQWFRPEAQTKAGVAQAYRAGWPGGIALGVLGALYDGSVPVQSALSLAMTELDGNAALVFQDGKLADEVSVNFNLEGGKVVKLDAKDKSWSLKLTPKTGLMSGTFTPNWPDAAKKSPVFSGVLLQKGANARGSGFFLSNAAGDTEPESGAVELGAP